MNKIFAAAVVAASIFALGAGSASAANMMPVYVGGAPMLSTKNIIENAVNSKDHTTLVAAVKAAGLVEALEGAGPFTVFAPTNAAFAALPAGTVDTLLKPENKPTLTKVLTYHVVPGRMDAAALMSAITAGGGKAMLVKILECHVIPAKAMSTDIMSMAKADGGTHVVDTVGGCKLSLKADGGKVTVTDENGNVANVTIADVEQSNGVIHVVDTVLMPM